MGCFWEFTREAGLQQVEDKDMLLREDEEWDDWVERLGFEPQVITHSWGILDNFTLLLHEGPHPPYLFEWNLDGHFEYVLVRSFPDYLEFLKSYLPIISHTLQIELLENFLDEVAIPDELAKNLLKFSQCLEEFRDAPPNVARDREHGRLMSWSRTRTT